MDAEVVTWMCVVGLPTWILWHLYTATRRKRQTWREPWRQYPQDGEGVLVLKARETVVGVMDRGKGKYTFIATDATNTTNYEEQSKLPAASCGVSEGVFALQIRDLQTSGLSEASFGESDPQRLKKRCEGGERQSLPRKVPDVCTRCHTRLCHARTTTPRIRTAGVAHTPHAAFSPFSWHRACTSRSIRQTSTAIMSLWMSGMSLAIRNSGRRSVMAKRNGTTKNHGMHQPDDAIAMLKEDHRRVRDFFQEYEAASDPRAKREIAEEVCVELETHAQLEEHIFYPTVNEETEEGARTGEGQPGRASDHEKPDPGTPDDRS